ncbi:MAG: adenylosuccinate synthase [Synergistaceae bacterium]|jgi:adenylosuccinate synthase|nr:adenylosuccinate synthase [Synergistaceae bacterium]
MNDRVRVLIGAQWGDEGKGRVVDVLAKDVDVVVRFQGGANAGHTVVVEGRKHVFHILPSGMLYPDRTCVIGNGLVIDPEELKKEIGELDPKPEAIGVKLLISYAAHIVMPYHKKLDALAEEARSANGSGPIGTTGRGIGPCYVDKYNRIGVRAEDLVSPEILRKKLLAALQEKNPIFEKIYGVPGFDLDELYELALGWGKFIEPYLGDSTLEIDAAIASGKNILFEGAQGTLLDIDHGTYPFVTSSSCVSGGASIGGALGPGRFNQVIGVVKAYCTRVGEGPFPTEERGEVGDKLRKNGVEFGATTGRPRRCGWLDLVALNYAVKVNGIDSIALTKLDVLSGIDGLKVCDAYEIDGVKYSAFPNSATIIQNAKPIYREMPSWSDDISRCRAFGDLPKEARDYVRLIEDSTSVKVSLIGVGPGREDTIQTGF